MTKPGGVIAWSQSVRQKATCREQRRISGIQRFYAALVSTRRKAHRVCSIFCSRKSRKGLQFESRYGNIALSESRCIKTFEGLMPLKLLHPGVAQLVARMVRDHEAVGSNPATRTMQSVLIGSEYPVMDTLLFYFSQSSYRNLFRGAVWCFAFFFFTVVNFFKLVQAEYFRYRPAALNQVKDLIDNNSFPQSSARFDRKERRS